MRKASTVLDIPSVKIISLWPVIDIDTKKKGSLLGMNMVLCVFGNIIIYCLQLIQNVLDCLHKHGFEASGERIGIIWIVLF